MMKLKSKRFKKPVVLSISDIHFSNPFKDGVKERNQDYIKSIQLEIEKIKPTHILINGDIVFSGKTEQFDNFYKSFLASYLMNNSETRLITTPGNHDIDLSIFDSYIQDIKIKKNSKNNKIGERIERLMENQFKTLKDKKELISVINEVFGSDHKFDFIETIFENYSSFVNKYIIKRLNTINKESKRNVIEFDSYENNKGLYGTIYDSEYKVIFACINSAKYFWTKKLYKIVTNYTGKEFRKETFGLYGNLSILESIESIDDDLNKYESQGVLNDSIVCLLSHVPLRWISYEEKFYKRQKFNAVIEKTDLAFFSHEHIEHFEPTTYKFRNKTYFFESPQLYDSKLDENDINKREKITESLGFSVFKLFATNKNFHQDIYILKNDINKEYSENEDFKWKYKTKKYKFKHNPLYSCYDFNNNKTHELFGSECKFYSYISNNQIKNYFNIDKHLHIYRDLYIDFNSLFKETRRITNDELFSKFELENKLIVFLRINKKINPNDVFDRLIDYLLILDKSLKIKDIHICFFDYQLFYIFADYYLIHLNGLQKNVWNNYKKLLYIWNVKFKAELYSKLTAKDKYKKHLSFFSNISIAFEPLQFEEYKSSIISIKEK